MFDITNSPVSSLGLCLWHLRRPSLRMRTSFWRANRWLCTSSDSAASSVSWLELILSTFLGVRMSGMSQTRQLSTARLMTLSTKVRSDIWHVCTGLA